MDQPETIATMEFSCEVREMVWLYNLTSLRLRRWYFSTMAFNTLILGFVLPAIPAENWIQLDCAMLWVLFVLGAVTLVVYPLLNAGQACSESKAICANRRWKFDRDGTELTDHLGKTVVHPWSSYRSIKIYRQWFLLQDADRRDHYIPFRAFEHGDQERLRALLEAKGLLKK